MVQINNHIKPKISLPQSKLPIPQVSWYVQIKHTQIQGSESKLRCLEVKPNEILFH